MLSGNLENLAATIGESVLPAITLFMSLVNGAVQMTERWWKGLGQVGTAYGNVAGKLIYGGVTPANFNGNAAVPDAGNQEIDDKNAAMVQEQLELDARTAAMKNGSKGAGYTDLQGLNKQIQDGISGGKDAILRDQTEILKRTEEIQKKQLAAIDKLAKKANMGLGNGAVPF